MSNSNQEIIEAKLATYIDGELDPADRADLETHLEQNPQYRRLVEELRKGREMLRGLPRESAPPELAEAFTSQLERSVLLQGETDKEEPRMRIGAGPRIFATAAILFLTFGLAAIVYFVLPGKGGHLVAVAPATRPALTPDDGQSTESLAANDKKGVPDEPSGDLKPVATATQPPAANKESDETRLSLAARNAASQPLVANKESVETAHLGRPAKNDLTAAGPSPSAGQSSDTRALNKTLGGNSEHGLRSGSRDAELDQLARDVSSDPQVKKLLSNNTSSKFQAKGASQHADNAVVLVVRASNPEQVRKELYAYLGDHNIDWQPGSSRVGSALNSTLAQQNDQLKKSESEAMRDAPSQARAEQSRTIEEKQKVAKLADAAPGGSSPFNAPAASDPSSAKRAEVASKSAASAPVSPKPAAAPAAIERPMAPRAPQAPALVERSVADAPRPVVQKQEIESAQNNAVAGDSLYVARRLSPQQAVELTACLARNGEVRKSDMSRLGVDAETPNKTAIASALPAEGARAKDDTSAAAPVAPESAKNGVDTGGAARAVPPQIASAQQAQGERNESMRKDAAVPRGGNAGVAFDKRGVDAVVKKGDELRLSYAGDNGVAERAETVKVKDDGTIEPQSLVSKGKPVQAAGKTLGEIEAELRQSAAETPAPTPSQPLKVARVESDLDARRSVAPAFGGAGKAGGPPSGADRLADARRRQAASAPVAAGAAVATTGLAVAPADAEQFVDIVIVLQKEPATPTSAGEPAAPPAQATAPVASPAPSTRPSSAAPASAPAK